MGKLAVVTGATGTIGAAITATLVDAGYDVLACSRSPARLENLAFLCARFPGAVWPWVINLAVIPDRVLADAWAGHFLTHGPADLLVCAHGAPPCTTPTLALTPAQVQEVYQVDVLGTLRMAQVVGAVMVTRREGAIVFVSSAHAHQTYPARVPYAMSKSAIVGLARALAVEWGPFNVTVNSVSPWQVTGTRSRDIAAHEHYHTGQDTLALYQHRSPLMRLVTPEDVASTVLWVGENRSMTGQDIRVDCGVAASMWHRGFEESSDG